MEKVVSGVIAPNYYGLITQERAEKFDLLKQLILNQTEAVILCGVEGIGKTTLLNALKTAKENRWAICLLQGLETLGFEQIKTQLRLTIQQQYPEATNQDLQFLLSFCEQQQQKVVLIIDDAAQLGAGLITTLTEYALHNPALRIVFAFTREQLFLKNITDSVLDECYFIEIPALTKPQIAVFLRDSSIFPNLDDQLQKINDKLLSKLYQHTHGIPGKIVTDLPLILSGSEKKYFSVLKGLLLISTAFMAAALFYLQNTRHDNNLLNSRAVPHSLPSKPVTIAIKPDVATVATHPNSGEVKVLVDPPKPSDLNKTAEIPINKQIIAEDVNVQWVLQQAPEKYTLQLMTFSKPQSLLGIVEKYHKLQIDLKILQIKSKNQEKFVLLYGSFVDLKTAKNAMKLLPSEFKDAWPRQFNALQKYIKNH